MTSEWGWTSHPLSAWPSILPEGQGGQWTGWSAVPKNNSSWPPERRKAVHQALVQQYNQASLTPPTSLEALTSETCRVVTVGHQLVLAGGPAFFHHKVLSAIRTARQLMERWQVPVVPVFWLASEDHDWKEVAAVHGAERPHVWEPLDADIPWPVGHRSLVGVREVLESWSSDGAPLDAVNDMKADLATAEQANETLSGLMRRWIHRWYGQEGVLVLDADHPDLKTSASALWASEFEGNGVHASLIGTEAFQGPAHVRENNVFWLGEQEGRVGVVRDADGDAWRAGTRRFTKSKEGWAHFAQTHAQSCSPGVLLRPLYQEWLLHSAAVVLGPGEWKYWHQLPQAFEDQGLVFPALRLRDHAVVLSEECHAVGWSLDQGWMTNEEWDRWVLDRWVDALGDEVRQHQSNLEAWNVNLQRWAAGMSPELKGPAGALEAATAKAWKQWMSKLRKSLKGSKAKEWQAARRACVSLVRKGAPQDRWANWHLLSGDDCDAWVQTWLEPEGGFEARVWCFGPTNV